MSGERGGRRGSFWVATGSWLVGLVALALVYRVAAWPDRWNSWSLAEISLFVPGWIGLLLPAAAFAGGLSASGILPGRGVALRGAVLAAVTYGLLAYVAPTVDYHRLTSRGVDAASEFPFGPHTPGGILAVREAVRANPPPAYSLRLSRPLESPPNWWTYLIHSVLAIAGFAMLAPILGQKAALVTSGLSPPVRSNARWGIGLATAVAFFVAEMLGGEWVLADPGNSGFIGAWWALLVPLAEMALFVALARRRTSLLAGAPAPRAG